MPYFLKLSESDTKATEFLSLGELATFSKKKKDAFKKLIERALKL